MRAIFVVISTTCLFATSGNAVAQGQHPNDKFYEYRVRSGVPQAPWYSRPTGAEKADWHCADQIASIGCQFIRTDLSEFPFIYRYRRGVILVDPAKSLLD
jgi:hypothetical protein